MLARWKLRYAHGWRLAQNVKHKDEFGCRIRLWRLPRPGRGVCGLRVNFIAGRLHFSEHSVQRDEIIGILAGGPQWLLSQRA
jgi:hypothetical protein